MLEDKPHETENLLVDGKFKIKLQSELYNLFVSPDNIKSNIDIGNAITQDTEVTNQNRGSGTEKYNLILAQDLAYATNIIRNVNCTVKATGVKYKSNKNYNNHYSGNTRTALDSLNVGVQNLNDMCGLCHPFFPGISGFITDPLNSALTGVNFSLGSRQTTVTQGNMSPEYVNARRKMTSNDVLTDPRFHGLLYPETFKSGIMEMESNKFRVIPWNVTPQIWNLKKEDGGEIVANSKAYPMIEDRLIGFSKSHVNNLTMTLDEVNDLEHNPYSIKKRGAIFKYATFNFEKSIASYNYKFTAVPKTDTTEAMHYFKPMASKTTALYDMVLGENSYHVQTDVENWKEAIDFGIDPQVLIFYPDGPQRVFKTDADKKVSEDPDYKQPDGQSVNITMTFPLCSPVMSPLLNDEVTRCFANANIGMLELLQNNDLSYLFKIIGGSGNSLDVTNPLHVITAPDNSNGNIKIEFSEQKITLRSYKINSLQSYIKKDIALPYMSSSITQSNLSTVVSTKTEELGSPKRSFNKKTLTTTTMSLGSNVPRYLLVYCKFPLAYKITNFQVQFQGSGNSQLLNMSTLMNATKTNGMHICDFDEDGYPIISNCTHDSKQIVTYKGYDSATPVGSFLLLKFGTDITLPFGILPGSSSVVCNVQYTFDIEFMDEYVVPGDTKFNKGAVFSGDLYVDHIGEYDYIISNDNSEYTPVNITPIEAANALDLTQKRIEGNYFTSSRSRMYSGGSFISSAYRGVRNAVSRLNEPIRNALWNLGKTAVKDHFKNVSARYKGRGDDEDEPSKSKWSAYM